MARNSYLRALYERQRSRIGHGKAIGAVKHSHRQRLGHTVTLQEAAAAGPQRVFLSVPSVSRMFPRGRERSHYGRSNTVEGDADV